MIWGRIAKARNGTGIPPVRDREVPDRLANDFKLYRQLPMHRCLKSFKPCFPAPPITGAPKVASMQIIADLEDSPREIYTGAIGYIGPNRQAQFSVAIRTALIGQKIQ